MKYIKQFGIILLISFLGEILRAVIPLPIPASIYGLVLMLAALMTHLLPLEAVQDSGKFLIEIMPLMFIPAAVGLLDSWSALRPILLSVAAITVVSTVVVMVISGKVTQKIIRMDRREKDDYDTGGDHRSSRGGPGNTVKGREIRVRYLYLCGDRSDSVCDDHRQAGSFY